MNVLNGLSGLRQLPAGSVVVIGNFDGVHRGHQALLARAKELSSKQINSSVSVVTFEPHPLTRLRPEKAPPRLTPRSLKIDLLAEYGVDHVVELAPEPDVLDLTAEQFWAILRDEVRPTHLVEGTEFNFGKGRGGNIDRLREWAAASPVQLHIVDEVEVVLTDMSVAPVSSTIVRWLIAYGRARDAAICLGRPYTLRGEVVKGYQRGRALGIPTANLRCDDQLVPDDGVYAGRCTINGKVWPAAVSIGSAPTFVDARRQVEAHLIGFDGDLYGQNIDLELVDWLRGQRKYDGVDALLAQIKRDVAETVERFDLNPAAAGRPIAV